mgnify:CR=1 FL=1
MAVKTKKVKQKSTGKVLTVYSSDGGKTWSKTDPTKTSKIKNYYTGNTKSKGTTAKERLDAKQKALDEARKPKVKKPEVKKPNLVQTPSPTWGVKKKKEEVKINKNKGEEKTVVKKKKITARSRMEARNREIHGDDAIDKLKENHRKFKESRRSSKEARIARRNERLKKKTSSALKINKK